MTSIPKRSELPEWQKGTDRQRGRALWRYLKERDLVDSFMRTKGGLVPATRLMSVFDGKIFKRERALRGNNVRTVNANLQSALALAANMQFLEAGAIYYVVRQRMTDEIEPEVRRIKNKIHRQRGAKKVRELRSAKALETKDCIRELLTSSKRKLSNGELARKAKCSESTARRYRSQLKKI